MAETFVITVISFALVLAVVASLLVWVILPALDEDTDEKHTKTLTLNDYIDQINSGNISAYSYDALQQDLINENSKKIAALDTRVTSLSSGSSGSGGAVTTATYASATGIWTIRDGHFKYTAREQERFVCPDNGSNCVTAPRTP